MTVTYEWRGDVDNAALHALHALHAHGSVTPSPRHPVTPSPRHRDRLARSFYFDTCGFTETTAGLIAL